MNKHLRFGLSLALVVALVVSTFTMPALAYSETLVGAGASLVEIVVEYQAATDNRAEIEAGAEGTRVYNVTLEWTPAGKIIYNAGKTIYSWNGNTLSYDAETTPKGWEIDNAAFILAVRNRSNRPVEVQCADPDPIAGVGINGGYDHAVMTLESAAPSSIYGVGVETNAQSVYSVHGVTGEINPSTTHIATITVTVIGK